MPLLELVGLAGLIMVVTVCLLDIMRSSWLLIPAMAVHAGLTVMIVGYCWKMASGGFADNSPTPRTAPTSAQHDCDDRPSRDDATETSAAQRAA